MNGPDDGNTVMALMPAWGAACRLTGYVLGRVRREDAGECCRQSPSPPR